MSSPYLLYTACFHQKQYVDIVVNMLKSFYDVNPNANIDFMVYTNTDYRAQIESQMGGRPVKFFEKNFVKTMNQSRISKVDIFDYPEIAQYEKIVYIDADTIFLRDPTPLFEAIVEDVVYASGEGNVLYEGNYWGRSLFLKNDPNCADQEGISVSCLGFKNLPEIKKMFSKIKQAFYLDMYQNKLLFYDQPFFNVFLINNQMVNKNDYKSLIQSRPTPEDAAKRGLVAVHFAGCPGHAQIKLDLFAEFKSKYVHPSNEDAITIAFVEGTRGIEDTRGIEEPPVVEEPQVVDEPLTEGSAEPLTEGYKTDTINEADLLSFIRSTNPSYVFDESTKRRNLFAASISSFDICFIGGDTAIPAAIAINNNPSVQVRIIESVEPSCVLASHRINARTEITGHELVIAEKRKYDTIVIDERANLEKAILIAMRIAKPGTTIIMNGVEDPVVNATWTKYVQMLEMEPNHDIKYKDTTTQSVRVIR
jgi:hypothetical protein